MHYNCLIVDDEVDLSKMTCEYFEMFDISCAYVETAAECERFLKENQVAYMLLIEFLYNNPDLLKELKNLLKNLIP